MSSVGNLRSFFCWLFVRTRTTAGILLGMTPPTRRRTSMLSAKRLYLCVILLLLFISSSVAKIDLPRFAKEKKNKDDAVDGSDGANDDASEALSSEEEALAKAKKLVSDQFE